jgi:HlyD family secretion protein
VAAGGHARQVPVALGGRNGSMAWVRSGLQAGQQVIVYPTAAVRDGVRVAARDV